MKQEDKDLLLQDLCGRLPYGVKCSHPYGIGKLESIAKEEHGIDVTFKTPDDNYYSIDDCKPYLFPLSSMTEEQMDEYDNLKQDIWDKLKDWKCAKLLDWLNKNHFDYRGLIEKGLAIDATGLNIY